MTQTTRSRPSNPRQTAVASARLEAAQRFLATGDVRSAHSTLTEILQDDAGNVPALLMMARIGVQAGQDASACKLLIAAAEQAPNRHDIWSALVEVLDRLAIADAQAIVAVRRSARPDVAAYRTISVHLMEQGGDHVGARDGLQAIVDADPDDAKGLLALGNAQRTLGDTDAAIGSYRRAISTGREVGRGYWALSDIKMFRFTEDEVVAMEGWLARDDLSAADRTPLSFALARAREIAGDHAAAFAQYQAANHDKRAEQPHDARAIDAEIEATRRSLTPTFFERSAAAGCAEPGPIFIVGLPRSGSTLVEQILASHSAIEATRELGDLEAIVRHIALSPQGRGIPYQQTLAATDAKGIEALGREYLRRTRGHRRTGLRLFIDKAPANFRHVGLIKAILPNAKIIDVRRDALGGGLSIYKQLFSRGFTFANALEDIAAYRRGYVRMMALWDDLLPGAVHRVELQDLVTDTETTVRRLLDHLGLPFEQACLDFHRTERAIRTPSAEQVRQPISMAALESWRPYERWLGPLAE